MIAEQVSWVALAILVGLYFRWLDKKINRPRKKQKAHKKVKK